MAGCWAVWWIAYIRWGLDQWRRGLIGPKGPSGKALPVCVNGRSCRGTVAACGRAMVLSLSFSPPPHLLSLSQLIRAESSETSQASQADRLSSSSLTLHLNFYNTLLQLCGEWHSTFKGKHFILPYCPIGVFSIINLNSNFTGNQEFFDTNLIIFFYNFLKPTWHKMTFFSFQKTSREVLRKQKNSWRVILLSFNLMIC